MGKLNIWQDIYGTEELEVLMGETQVIIPMQERMCPSGFVFKLVNAEIVVGGAMSGVDYPLDGYSMPMPPGQTSRALSWRRSMDNGQTWQETPSWPSYHTHQFLDGEIIQISGGSWFIENDQNNIYSVALFRSTNNGYTFKKTRVPVLGVPKLATEEKHRGSRRRYTNINHQIVKISDGSLLASAQGKFENDIKERTFIIRSADRGKTWNYLSTVAFDLTRGKEIRLLGFDEPNLLMLPNGEILCFMRTGSRCGGSLYMSRSKDDGKTWGHADPIADYGAYPTACLMKNGIIAVVYGRPGDWLTFSLDQGETFINHFCFNKGPEPNDCGNYDWVEEIAPDTLLVIYSRTDPNNCMISEIMGIYFIVRPKKRLDKVKIS